MQDKGGLKELIDYLASDENVQLTLGDNPRRLEVFNIIDASAVSCASGTYLDEYLVTIGASLGRIDKEYFDRLVDLLKDIYKE